MGLRSHQKIMLLHITNGGRAIVAIGDVKLFTALSDLVSGVVGCKSAFTIAVRAKLSRNYLKRQNGIKRIKLNYTQV